MIVDFIGQAIIQLIPYIKRIIEMLPDISMLLEKPSFQLMSQIQPLKQTSKIINNLNNFLK